MSRYFVDKGADIGEIITVSGDDFHHIKNVLRKRPGDSLTVCDMKGMEYIVSIKRVYKDCLEACVEEVFECGTESTLSLTLYQGLPKSDKMEFIIQKSVELGITRVVPVASNRCVVKLDENCARKKTDRWQKIAIEAAKQSNRGIVPRIDMPMTFEKAIERAREDALAVIPYEKETSGSLRDAIGNLRNSIQILAREGKGTNLEVSIFIGPEGGFEESEVSFAKENGVKSVTLGPRILRTETAGLAVISILMYELGDIGS